MSVIDFENLKKEMQKSDTKFDMEMSEYENKMSALYNEKKYKEALDISVKMMENFNESKTEEDNFMNSVKKHIIKLNNITSVHHLQKGENEMAKYFLNISEKFLHKDLDTYLITKNNYSCYFTNVRQLRNAKGIMLDSLKINTLKKVGEMLKGEFIGEDFSEIAGDYTNICSIDNKLKNYYESLIDGMHSLALNQLTVLNEKIATKRRTNEEKIEFMLNNLKSGAPTNSNNGLILSYYNLGVQQEYLKRNSDAEISYNKSMYYTDKNSTDKNLVSKLSNCELDKDTSKKSVSKKHSEINFKDSFSHHDITIIKSDTFHLQEKVSKLKVYNDVKKVKSNPYFIHTMKNFEKYTTGNAVKNKKIDNTHDSKKENKKIKIKIK